MKAIDSTVAKALLLSLKTRYHVRKNNTLVAELKFLENPKALKETDQNYQLPSKTTLTRHLRATHDRLYPSTTPSPTSAEDDSPENTSANEDDLFKKFCNYIKPDDVETDKDTFSKEVLLFVSGGERTTALSQLYDALKGVPPTSVEAERVFSVTGLFLTELRSRMNPTTVDVLVFLKYFLLSKK